MMRRITIITIQPPTIILALLVGNKFNTLSYVLFSNKVFGIFIQISIIISVIQYPFSIRGHCKGARTSATN